MYTLYTKCMTAMLMPDIICKIIIKRLTENIKTTRTKYSNNNSCSQVYVYRYLFVGFVICVEIIDLAIAKLRQGKFGVVLVI